MHFEVQTIHEDGNTSYVVKGHEPNSGDVLCRQRFTRWDDAVAFMHDKDNEEKRRHPAVKFIKKDELYINPRRVMLIYSGEYDCLDEGEPYCYVAIDDYRLSKFYSRADAQKWAAELVAQIEEETSHENY